MKTTQMSFRPRRHKSSRHNYMSIIKFKHIRKLIRRKKKQEEETKRKLQELKKSRKRKREKLKRLRIKLKMKKKRWLKKMKKRLSKARKERRQVEKELSDTKMRKRDVVLDILSREKLKELNAEQKRKVLLDHQQLHQKISMVKQQEKEYDANYRYMIHGKHRNSVRPRPTPHEIKQIKIDSKTKINANIIKQKQNAKDKGLLVRGKAMRKSLKQKAQTEFERLEEKLNALRQQGNENEKTQRKGKSKKRGMMAAKSQRQLKIQKSIMQQVYNIRQEEKDAEAEHSAIAQKLREKAIREKSKAKAQKERIRRNIKAKLEKEAKLKEDLLKKASAVRLETLKSGDYRLNPPHKRADKRKSNQRLQSKSSSSSKRKVVKQKRRGKTLISAMKSEETRKLDPKVSVTEPKTGQQLQGEEVQQKEKSKTKLEVKVSSPPKTAEQPTQGEAPRKEVSQKETPLKEKSQTKLEVKVSTPAKTQEQPTKGEASRKEVPRKEVPQKETPLKEKSKTKLEVKVVSAEKTQEQPMHVEAQQRRKSETKQEPKVVSAEKTQEQPIHEEAQQKGKSKSKQKTKHKKGGLAASNSSEIEILVASSKYQVKENDSKIKDKVIETAIPKKTTDKETTVATKVGSDKEIAVPDLDDAIQKAVENSTSLTVLNLNKKNDATESSFKHRERPAKAKSEVKIRENAELNRKRIEQKKNTMKAWAQEAKQPQKLDPKQQKLEEKKNKLQIQKVVEHWEAVKRNSDEMKKIRQKNLEEFRMKRDKEFKESQRKVADTLNMTKNVLVKGGSKHVTDAVVSKTDIELQDNFLSPKERMENAQRPSHTRHSSLKTPFPRLKGDTNVRVDDTQKSHKRNFGFADDIESHDLEETKWEMLWRVKQEKQEEKNPLKKINLSQQSDEENDKLELERLKKMSVDSRRTKLMNILEILEEVEKFKIKHLEKREEHDIQTQAQKDREKEEEEEQRALYEFRQNKKREKQEQIRAQQEKERDERETHINKIQKIVAGQSSDHSQGGDTNAPPQIHADYEDDDTELEGIKLVLSTVDGFGDGRKLKKKKKKNKNETWEEKLVKFRIINANCCIVNGKRLDLRKCRGPNPALLACVDPPVYMPKELIRPINYLPYLPH